MNSYYLIIDIGGTKTTAAVFTEDGQPLDGYFHVVPSVTYQGEEAVYLNSRKALQHVIDHFNLNMDEVLGIGIGGPGPLDAKRGIIIGSPMMNWHKPNPVVDLFKRDFGKPGALDNDGNLGALAEQRCGLGKGMQNVLYMTVSTGCGGGAVLNGEIYHGHNDSAAEFGHMSLFPDGRPCPCGNRGCLEVYASGSAMKWRMAEDLKAGKKSMAFEAIGYDPEKVDGKYLTEAAEAGDPYALDFYRKEGFYLGCALANMFNAFDPDIFVLGGGVTKARKYFHEEMMKTLKERAMMDVPDERVQYSVLNDKVVLYGAYYRIRDYLKSRENN